MPGSKTSSPFQYYRGAIPFVVALFFYLQFSPSSDSIWGEVGEIVHPINYHGRSTSDTKISVFTALPHASDSTVEKNLRKLQMMISSNSSSPWNSIVVSPAKQKAFILKNGGECHENTISVYERFLANGMTDMALEVWKYCKMLLDLKDNPATAYIDFESPLLTTFGNIFDEKGNYAVLGDDRYLSTSMIHGSVLVIQKDQSNVLKTMIASIVNRDHHTLKTDPFFLSKTLFNSIHDPTVVSNWNLMKQHCHVDVRKKTEGMVDDNESTYFKCPKSQKYCCEIQAPVSREQQSYQRAVMMTTHFVLPQPLLPNYEHSPKPYALDRDAIQVVPSRELQVDTPFIVTIRDDVSSKRGGGSKANSAVSSAYAQLKGKKCLSRYVMCLFYHFYKRLY